MLSRDAQGLGTKTRQPKSEAPAPTYHHIHIPFLPAGRKSRKKLRHGLYRIHSQDRHVVGRAVFAPPWQRRG